MTKQVRTHFDGYTITEGQLVSDRVQRIVMAIMDYSPELRVDWIPDRQAQAENRPQFKIVHAPPSGEEFILFFVKNEEEFDERVLLRIIQNDQGATGQQTLSEFEAAEATKKLIEKQVYLDAMEEAEDIAAHILKTHKNTYVVNKDLVIKDGIPFNAAKLKD